MPNVVIFALTRGFVVLGAGDAAAPEGPREADRGADPRGKAAGTTEIPVWRGLAADVHG